MLVSGIGLWIVYALADRALMAGMRKHLEDIAVTTIGRIDVEGHEALTSDYSVAQPGSDEYARLCDPLVKLRYEVPDIYYAYTLSMVDGTPAFILDSTAFYQNEGDDTELEPPGSLYDDAPQEVYDAWTSGRTIVVHEPYTDKWGTFISAFAPFRNAQDQVVGVFGVDISMGQLADRRKPVNMAALLAAAGCVIGSSIIGLFRWRADTRLMDRESRLLEAQQEAQMGERAARAGEQAKSTFLATMSHEIRTPLNGVLGMAELLSKSELQSGQREQVEAIRHSGELLLVMLNDILDFSKIDAGAMSVHSEPVDLEALLQEAAGLYRGAAEKKGLSIEVDCREDAPKYVQVDPTRAAQVLGNLISNAIKFTERGGVHLVASCHEDGEMANIRVEDTGIGIPNDKLKDLFVPFSQLDSGLNRAAGGTGLGLVISRHLAEMMGGGIEAFSKLGEGSTFQFLLPMAHAAPDPETPAEGESVIADIPAGLKVLVAEDVEVNRKVVGLMLERLGIKPSYAEDGEEATSVWREQRPDVILMDVQMPKMDGREATRKIRQESGDSNQPWIIALTGGVMDDDQVGAAISGMNGFLAKPITLDGLRSALAKVPKD